MKPKTNIEKQAVAISRHLPALSDKQKQWAYRYLPDHFAFRHAKGVLTCGECAASWQGAEGTLADTLCGITCPHCGAALKLHTHRRKRVIRQKHYGNIFSTCKGWQVIRTVLLESTCRKGERADCLCREVVRHLISPEGRSVTMALPRATQSGYFDLWQLSGTMEIRCTKNPVYESVSDCPHCPHMRIIPELRRNGFKGDFHRIHPCRLFSSLLRDSKAETLLKSGQTDLLRHFTMRTRQPVSPYWQAIRICIRKGYTVRDASLWCDYIDLLIHFGKDISNACYVCPPDLHQAHDRQMNKRREQQRREKRQRQLQQAAADEKRYSELKSGYLDLQFSDGEIQVSVLQSVREHAEEGEQMCHCLFTCGYHLKPHSLILSARIGERRIETVEFSLESLAVVQSRGVRNQHSPYHERIVDLVNRHAPLIVSRMKDRNSGRVSAQDSRYDYHHHHNNHQL